MIFFIFQQIKLCLNKGLQKYNYACTHLEEVNYVGQVTVAGGILESSAFEGCESLTKIILPQSISELQEGVFIL